MISEVKETCSENCATKASYLFTGPCIHGNTFAVPLLSGLLYLAATKASPEGCRLVEMFTRGGVTGGCSGDK
jgi:hypothetical protein